MQYNAIEYNIIQHWAANAVYQNDRTGEITAMNTASSAFVEDKSLTPDENNVATFEELFHLDNDKLPLRDFSVTIKLQ